MQSTGQPDLTATLHSVDAALSSTRGLRQWSPALTERPRFSTDEDAPEADEVTGVASSRPDETAGFMYTQNLSRQYKRAYDELGESARSPVTSVGGDERPAVFRASQRYPCLYFVPHGQWHVRKSAEDDTLARYNKDYAGALAARMKAEAELQEKQTITRQLPITNSLNRYFADKQETTLTVLLSDEQREAVRQAASLQELEHRAQRRKDEDMLRKFAQTKQDGM